MFWKKKKEMPDNIIRLQADMLNLRAAFHDAINNLQAMIDTKIAQRVNVEMDSIDRKNVQPLIQETIKNTINDPQFQDGLIRRMKRREKINEAE